MLVEIDQSGKLEQLNTDTVIAFANGKKNAVYLKAGAKRKIIQFLRSTLIPQNEFYPILFAIVIFIMIDSLEERVTLLIDEEYTGKNAIIRETLVKLLGRRFKKQWQGQITFGQIGKHSEAHKLAWMTHRMKRRKTVRRISAEEILKHFQ